ncbi:Chitin synthase 8 [Cyphellophora attinorum]|uniref:chitin synthase n=1 Tax=Cyphellophora attinorum TaxID=1664694 RepID=A0A0N1P116_9EURO|nr:Chitin synthase 8 [Phialophora attinorum]KPI43673.1 Chitin synthase 8 [Phialophora attinorum]
MAAVGAAGANQPAHAQPNLPALPPHLQSDTHLTAHLASRFHVSLPTAKLSSQALVCLNTYTSATRGPNGGKEGSAAAEAEDLARRAWTRLGSRAEDQAVIFFGESGSGKTTIRSHLLSAFLGLSSTPLSNRLSLAAYVFDTLTTTKSSTTQTASKAGLFYELQYDASSAKPTLIGGKLLDHRLERSRVTAVPTGERSYHVLYYLLAGTSAAEKEHLGLEQSTGTKSAATGLHRSASSAAQKRWRYLGHPTQLKVGINDAEGFQHFKTALRKLEFPRGDIAEICQVLAAILHIGQLEFGVGQATATAAEESGGYSHEGGESVTMVKNSETLGLVAAFLGLGAAELEESLRYKTKTIHRERVTVMLDPKGARESADELARTLYALLVAYIIECINQRTCAAEDAVANTVSIIDFPGFADQTSTGSVLDQLLNNAASESLYNICLQSIFERPAEMLEREEVSVPAATFFDNSDAVRGLLKHGTGLLAILDDQTKRGRSDMQLLESLRKKFENKNKSITVSSSTAKMPGSNFATTNLAASFSVRHYAGEVEYPVNGLVEANGDTVAGDLMNLMKTTKSDFVGNLFGQEALTTVTHPAEKTAIMQAQVSSKPLRKPSMARRKHDQLARLASRRADRSPEPQENESQAGEAILRRTKDNAGGLSQGAASQFLSSLDNITKSLTAPNVNNYFIFCLKPNDRRIANQFDSKCVRQQIQILGIAEISQRLRTADFSIFLPFGEFLGLVDFDPGVVGSDAEKTQLVLDAKNWPPNEFKIGTTGVFLSERCWASVAVSGTQAAQFYGVDDDGLSIGTPGGNPFSDSKARLHSAGDTPGAGSYIYGDETKGAGYFGAREIDTKSEAGASAFHQGDMFRNMDTKEELAEKANKKKLEEIDVIATTGKRKRWLFVVYFLTWYIPDFSIKWLGRMPRKDVRVAWREKLAINMMIWFFCLFACFFIVVFPELICPRQNVFSAAELSSHDGKGTSSYASLRGIVLDLGAFAPNHYPSIVPTKDLENYAGLDITGLFPVQVSALCNGKDGSVDPHVTLDYTSTNISGTANVISGDDPNRKYHDFRSFTNDPRPDWFFEQRMVLAGNYKKGDIGYTPQYVKTLSTKQKSIAIIHDRVYDFTNYITGGRSIGVAEGEERPTDVDTDFMSDAVVALFQQRSGQDVSRYWDALTLPGGIGEKNRMQTQCLFARYILLAISILLVSVIGFKFFAALQFSRKTLPENLDKFVICQVPAYTEDEESLRRAIDSAARMKYDDKRKLLIIVCDGMIIGQGNDRPTPRIVLDILGVSETVDPEPLSFESLGEGMKQHNMGKVYSGLYEVQGHIVPFMVVVKVGKPSEVSRPGNRGKRDSQMVIMRFLNRVHYNLPMSPLELEMHHQIRNIIGVNPTFYEFMLQIDADTVVAPDSATRMISTFLHDTRIIAVCGETSLSNSKSSIITMIQVYEYYISHNLTKAFESLFGSVTCLPGCFSMYRIRAAETGKPLFVCKEICEDYSEIRVDTLHMKNLLHLGEDRYLTTLLLKHHPKFKTKFIFNAHAWTIAPDSWAVFMSQRRRWINSTVHNLMELIPLQQLCGFCCFSMRFIVFLDLLSTLIAPVAVAYIVYLIVLLAIDTSVVPLMAFVLLGAIYGLQAIIFILRRKWEMIAWMIIYILAMPVFSLGLPLYAFWHMDDFSWGNTRLVTGESGNQILVSDEGKFDPDSIPKKKWEEYQAELWDAQTQRDDTKSEMSGYSYGTKSYYPTGSVYGGDQQHLLAQSRSVSQFDVNQSVYGAPMAYTQSRCRCLRLSFLAAPEDDMLLQEIREILRTADLMSVTKKSVKQELERRFSCNLDAKRAYIGSATEAVLSGQL